MKRNLVFFINPISGARSKHALEEKIASKCEKEQASWQILFTNKEGEYSFLKEKIRTEEISDVVICGGDGSVGPIVSALLGVDVNVGIIPMGSGNGLARTAGISYHTNKALDIVFQGIAKPVDAFTVNGRLGCQITGLGFDAYIAKLFSEERKRGLSTYTKLAVRNFFKARPYQFELSHDGLPGIQTKAFIICVSNANQFGNNLKIAPQASLHDGLLDVVILRKTSKMQILVSFVNHLLFAKKMKDMGEAGRKRILYFNSRKVIIKNIELAPIHIDGDPAEAKQEYVISIVPAAFRLIHPRDLYSGFASPD